MSINLTDKQISEDFAHAVLSGLDNQQKKIPSRFLYDTKGSELFEDITNVEEYYPTRTEITILQKSVAEIAKITDEKTILIEFGSGSSKKTPLLIEALHNLEAYIPIDISNSALIDATKYLQRRFQDLEIIPLHADFTQEIKLPPIKSGFFNLGFFPGSTLGNFEKHEAIEFLKTAKQILGENCGLIIGIDLQKCPEILIPAYDDSSGVTASFNLNLLSRINRELDGNFDINAYEHKAIYNEHSKRIEMHIESLTNQTVNILGYKFEFEKGETIHTENSHKYSIESFKQLASEADWSVLKHWTDKENLFSLHYLIPTQNGMNIV